MLQDNPILVGLVIFALAIGPEGLVYLAAKLLK
jgi:hypothetical protein